MEYMLMFGAVVIAIMIGTMSMSGKTARHYVTVGSVADKTTDVLAAHFGVKAPAPASDPNIETQLSVVRRAASNNTTVRR